MCTFSEGARKTYAIIEIGAQNHQHEEDIMGFLKDYEWTYKELTGSRLNWRGTFGFAFPRLDCTTERQIRLVLGKLKDFKYEDPDGFVSCIRRRCKHLWDPTLMMLHEMGIGDFDELWEPESEEEDELPGSFGELISTLYWY